MADLVSMRIAYGQALIELGQANPDVVVLSADVSNSDHSYMFEEVFPERFFNVGIAEQSLVDVAVGLAYMLDLVPRKRTAEFVGFSVFSIAVAQLLGPLLGGKLIDEMGYRSIFPAAAMLMIVGLVILQFVRPRAAPRAHRPGDRAPEAGSGPRNGR